ncbi:MAG: MogA/MoaB family molybdenum cofactor biosynthesis protein [Chloroflexi bacterium]|nr:MogA/MoaB family molybdenum cofactor biosynthesis protein [Chloroflexota bacterium]MBI1855078.1 MogA/MoaB family molybdenum cofactor biosynthesis protein [Chloroflexota bacterium]MBI3339499.1 MogA/MoaB family molybdenum cofactor biosynthesis protein [Chloroflexota bacterium]
MSLRIAVLTVSDRSSRGERPDESGPALVEVIHSKGWTAALQAILPDDLNILRETLAAWADSGGVDIILTTGGTGFAPRDVTPEATRGVIEREAPGLAEAMRAASLSKSAHAMLSRAVTGIRGKVLIINLPGSPKGAVENLQVVLPALEHAVKLLHDAPDAEAGHNPGSA